jgi:outer membrane lipoprotein-sorting protein
VTVLKRFFLVILCVTLFLVSCKSKETTYNAHSKIMGIKSYTADVKVTVYGTKVNSVYKMKHYYSAPDKLRIETEEPGFLKGQILIFNGKKWTTYNPLINMSFNADNLSKEDEFIFLGVIQKSIVNSEDTKYGIELKDGHEYLQVKSTIPDGNEYKKYVVLYMNKDDYTPVIMEILDNEGRTGVRIEYSNFIYNAPIESNCFTIPASQN